MHKHCHCKLNFANTKPNGYLSTTCFIYSSVTFFWSCFTTTDNSFCLTFARKSSSFICFVHCIVGQKHIKNQTFFNTVCIGETRDGCSKGWAVTAPLLPTKDDLRVMWWISYMTTSLLTLDLNCYSCVKIFNQSTDFQIWKWFLNQDYILIGTDIVRIMSPRLDQKVDS